jgi:hypothetical protein
MFTLATWLWLLVVVAASEVKVWPKPTYVVHGHESLWLKSDLISDVFCGNGTQVRQISLGLPKGSNLGKPFQSIIRQFGEWHASFRSAENRSPFDTDDRVYEEAVLIEGIESRLQSIKTTKLVPWKLFPRRSVFEPHETADSVVERLEISQAVCPAESFTSEKFFDADESYEISIDRDLVLISSNSTLGTFRALGKSC